MTPCRHWLGGIALLLAALPAIAASPATATLTSVGSDTLGELMLAWAQRYALEQPALRLQIRTPGSAAAPAALAGGAADLGPMSRAMNEIELADYRARRHRDPGRIRVAFDAVVVFVHPDNPLPALSLDQAAGIWGVDAGCAGTANAAHWGDLAIPPPLATRPLLRLGRNTASGTFEFFHKEVLCGGAYRNDVVQFPGAGAVVAAVARLPDAIGYAGLGHANGLVRVLPLRRSADQAAVAPDTANVISGRYPLSRPLYIYFNRADDGRPDPTTAAFLRFALSESAQEIAVRYGFVALPAADVPQQLGQLQ